MSDAQGTGTGNNDAVDTQNADDQKSDAQGDGKPVDGKPADDKSAPNDKPADKPADKSEVAYEFKAPEGMKLDTKSVDEFKSIAKELKLPAEAAQKVADIAIQAEVRRAEAWRAQVQTWADEVGKDAELSKPEVQADARTAIETFGTPELKTLLNSTGMGNHPELVRLMAKVGKALSEDKVLGKGNGDKPARDAASILYGSN